MRSICKKEGCNEIVVGRGLCNKHYIRERRGITDKYKKRLEINEQCFHGKLDEYKSYYIGIIQTDGWIYPRPEGRQVEIGLKMNDEDVVRGFSDFVNLPHMVKERNREEGNKFWRISFLSDKIANRLTELGVTSRKTYEEFYPEGVIFKHYIRGFFEGDGWLDSAERPNMLFTGKPCLNKVCKRLDKLNFDYNVIPTYDNGKDIKQYDLYIKGGKKGYKRFLDFMYEDAQVYMDRKYNRYREVYY